MGTPAKNLEQPARGSNVGVWDTPVNNNTGIIDAALGQITTISVSAGSVILAANQFQCNQIVLNSTLLANITITFPTSFTGPYTISHVATGSSAFTITLQTTAGGQVICAMPGEVFDVFNDGTNLKYKNIGHRVGQYWDYCGTAVPNWVTGCTVPPYLHANGGTFSSATYPQLTAILGGTTLPDSQGRFRATLNSGTGRITSGSSTGGIDGNTLLSAGGNQVRTLSSQNVPPSPVTDLGHSHPISFGANVGGAPGNPTLAPPITPSSTGTHSGTVGSTTTGITVGNASPTNFSILPPAYIGGITLIRAA